MDNHSFTIGNTTVYFTKGQAVGEVQRMIHGQVERYEDINVKQDRAGHHDRDLAVRQIEQAEATGHITLEEAEARKAHAITAETQYDLQGLTVDLPAPSDHRTYWQAYDFDDAKYFLPVLLSTMFAGFCSAIIPGCVLGAADKLGTTLGQAVFWPLLILGAISIITSLVLIVIKTAD